MARILSLCLLGTLMGNASAQDTTKFISKRTYFSAGSQIAFTSSILEVNGNDRGAVVRFAPVLNGQRTLNKDLSTHFGLFLGLSVSNVGFIYDVPDSDHRYKFRTYNLGLPVGFKIGSMNAGLFFAGYSFEWAFHYKEKKFLNGTKEDKVSVWLSDRNQPFQQAVMAGVQLRHGTTLQVKYYFTELHDQDHTETIELDGVVTTVMPYRGLQANILQLSLGFALFTDEDKLYQR